MKIKSYNIFCILLFVAGVLILSSVFLSKGESPMAPILILLLGCGALYLMGQKKLKQYAFTVWVTGLHDCSDSRRRTAARWPLKWGCRTVGWHQAWP
jgi:hypothetical protein